MQISEQTHLKCQTEYNKRTVKSLCNSQTPSIQTKTHTFWSESKVDECLFWATCSLRNCQRNLLLEAADSSTPS